MLLVLVSLAGNTAVANDSEISLFDSRGEAVAYIAMSDGFTLYLWDGDPVAYLVTGSSNDPAVYGFNGQHLGWFRNGAIFDHDGNAACATKAAMGSTSLEPLKSLKSLKPLKSLKELAPLRPLFSNQFGTTPCAVLLRSGAN